MAKKANTTKGAAEKARRNPEQPEAATNGKASRMAKAATPRPSEALVTENDLAIVEAARAEAQSDLGKLRDALHEVLRRSNALQLSVEQRKRLPESAKKGAWDRQWKPEYQSWLKSIRDAVDATNRPAVAAMMDSAADDRARRQQPTSWTALVRDSLERLLASLHPMQHGADGLGFIRAGGTSLPEPFKWPLVQIRLRVAELEMLAPAATPAAKGVPQSASAATERVAESESEAAPIALSANERKLLKSMASKDGAFLWSASDLGDSTGVTDETARRFVARLCDHGLAERPNGARRGARLTTQGRAQARGL